jgi:hypothetical protein
MAKKLIPPLRSEADYETALKDLERYFKPNQTRAVQKVFPMQSVGLSLPVAIPDQGSEVEQGRRPASALLLTKNVC